MSCYTRHLGEVSKGLGRADTKDGRKKPFACKFGGRLKSYYTTKERKKGVFYSWVSLNLIWPSQFKRTYARADMRKKRS